MEGARQSALSLVRRRINGAEKRGCQWSGKLSSGSPLTELDGETSLSMGTKIMEWVSITALLLVVSCRPTASYQIPLDLAVCAGPVMGVLALFFIKREIETHYDVDNSSNPASRVTVKLRAWRSCAPLKTQWRCQWQTQSTGNHADRGRRSFAGIRRSQSEPWTSSYMFLHGRWNYSRIEEAAGNQTGQCHCNEK